MKIFFVTIISCLTVLMLSCKKEQPELPSVVGIAKDIDSNFYNYTEIKGDIWMIQNLNTSRFQNGDTIERAITDDEWEDAHYNGRPAWCYYDNDSLFGNKYGKIYNWYALNDPRGIAPEGWHVATKEEWVNLRDSYGGEWNAGYHLKSESDDWLDGGKGINDSRFSALPGGYRMSTGFFSLKGKAAWYWTSKVETPDTPFSNYAPLLPSINNLLNITTRSYGDGVYIRCVKD
jgi:uncharacterized protein (TIGR02145 family)